MNTARHLPQPLRLLFLGILLLSLFSFTIAQDTVTTTGDVIADLGFRPDTDGFSFENYGGDAGYESLTSAEVVRFFGEEAVCASAADDEGFCVLKPNAQVWMETVLEYMGGGHCEGMATLSLLLYGKALLPSDFDDVEYTYDLELDNNDLLQREIGYWWATQVLSPVQTDSVTGTPTNVLSTLIDTIQEGYYTLFFFQPDFTAGHAVSPYAVIDDGDGLYRIAIYDNNYPNEERYVEVDTASDTWRYNGSTNPDEAEFVYEGDADTQTLGLTPMYLRFQQPFECPFCDGTQGEGTAALTGSTQIVINNWSPAFAELFSNATAIYPVFNQRVPAVRVIVPSTYQFTLPAGSAAEQISVAFYRNGSVTRLSNIALTQAVSFEIEDNSISYDGADDVEFSQGVSTAAGDYRFEIVTSGDGFTLEIDPATGDFRLSGDAGDTFELSTEIYNEDGSVEFYEAADFSLDEDGEGILNPEDWESDEDIESDAGDEEAEFDGSDGNGDGDEDTEDEDASDNSADDTSNDGNEDSEEDTSDDTSDETSGDDGSDDGGGDEGGDDGGSDG